MIAIKTHQIQPKYNNMSVNTQFELPPDRYYLGMRLCGFSYTDNLAGVTVYYNWSAGVLSNIKSISLYDGNIFVDGITNKANELLKVFNINSQNRRSLGLKQQLSRSAVGYNIEMYDGLRRVSPVLADPPLLPNNNPQTLTGQPYLDVNFNDDNNGDLAGDGYLDLKGVLSFLNSGVNGVWKLKNPRLVIEWSMNPNECFAETYPRIVGGAVVTTRGTAVLQSNANIPYLIVEEVLDPRLQVVPDRYIYQSIESDSTILAGVAGGVPVSNTYRLNGLSNKLVGRMLFEFQNNTTIAPKDGTLNSQVQNNESYQVYLDNMPMYPNQGESRELKQHHFNEVWGALNSLYVQYQGNITSLFVSDATGIDPTRHPWLQGNIYTNSYGALNVGSKFKTFDFLYTRSNNADALTFTVFAEVYKELTFDNDGDAVVTYL